MIRSHVEIEADSMILVQIVLKKVDPAFLVHCLFRELFPSMTKLHFKTAHTFRENNKGADYLANMGCKNQREYSFVSFYNLPKELMGIDKARKMRISRFEM